MGPLVAATALLQTPYVSAAVRRMSTEAAPPASGEQPREHVLLRKRCSVSSLAAGRGNQGGGHLAGSNAIG
eukprot:3278221-Pleurochrysis_carterae.AAC.3